MPKWPLIIILSGTAIVFWMLWSYAPLVEPPNNNTVENYPAYLPKNFEGAPQKLDCKLEDGNKPYAKFYRNAAEKWSLVILGKNGRSQYIYFQKTLSGEEGDGESINEWKWVGSGWVNLEKLSSTEKETYSGGKFLFSELEKKFIVGCYKIESDVK